MQKFRKLLLECITEDIKGAPIERLTQAKAIFEAEMVSNGRTASPQLTQDWLQGLCSTISVPYMQCDIVGFYEASLKRKCKSDAEYTRWCDEYWKQCGRTLFDLFYN